MVVVSDHGQLPIFQVVRPNRALADAGLVQTIDEDGRLRVSPDTPMLAFTGGAIFHLYLNLDGREPGGVVSMTEAPDLLRRAAPWTELMLREGKMVNDLNVKTRDRVSVVLAFVLPAAFAEWMHIEERVSETATAVVERLGRGEAVGLVLGAEVLGPVTTRRQAGVLLRALAEVEPVRADRRPARPVARAG